MGRVSRFALLVSKFRGCLVGSLAGDCFGRRSTAAVDVGLRSAADADPLSMSALGTSLQAGVSMSILRSVGESLIRVRGFDRDDLSSSLRRLHEDQVRISSRCADAGFGSVGAVVCAAPIVMYFYGDLSRAVQVTGESAGLVQRSIGRTPASSQSETSSGAVLHCLALQLAFQFDPIRPLNVELFLARLMSDMAEHEATGERHSSRHAAGRPPVIVDHDKPSLRRLEIVRDMLRSNRQPPINLYEDAIKALDGDLVTTAIYAFLQVQRGQRIDGAENVTAIERLLRQTLPLTLPLPLLACGLIGAFLGIESVPHSVRQLCDGLQKTVKLADKLALQFETQPSVYDRPEISLSQRL